MPFSFSIHILCQDFGETCFPSNGWIPYPVKSRKPEPLSSPLRIPFSFPILRPVPRFWLIRLPEKWSNAVSRQEFSRFPESRTVFQPNPGSRRYPSRHCQRLALSISSGGLSKYNTIISDQSTFLIFLLLYTWATLNFTFPEEEQIPTKSDHFFDSMLNGFDCGPSVRSDWESRTLPDSPHFYSELHWVGEHHLADTGTDLHRCWT